MPSAHRRRRHVLGVVVPVLVALGSAVVSAAPAQAAGPVRATDVCAAVPAGYARCFAQALELRSGHGLVHPPSPGLTLTPTSARRHTAGRILAHAAFATAGAAAASPQPGTPAYLQQAYDLTALSQTAGGSDTVAVVDAFDNPAAEADLAAYRAAYGLPACTTAGGCFRKVNESGAAAPLPVTNASWAEEESLDLDAVSALCPNCHLLLVEASSNGGTDLYNGIAAAQALGANQISNSWGAASAAPPGGGAYQGVAVLAGTGDSGYPGAGQDVYPAAYPSVTAVGGTTLTAAAGPRGFAETAWSLSSGWGGGSGCDLNEPKPAYQTDAGCTGRAYADVSADASPATGLSVYDSAQGGWIQMGGTSLSTPLTAAFEAVTGVGGATAQWAYADSALLNDPAAGSTGACAATILYICTGQSGYDGPTGAGSISGAVVPGAPGIGGPGTAGTDTQAATAQTATLSGGVDPNQLDTRYWWQYGTSTAYGQQTAPADLGAGALPVTATTTVTGLAPSTTYHYRLVAANADGTSYGYDFTVTTGAQPKGSGPPVNTAVPAVSGIAQQGRPLHAAAGRWAPTATGLAYQWQRSADRGRHWSAIAGATSASYTLSASDVNDICRVVVVAVDAGGSAAAVSASSSQVTPAPRVHASAVRRPRRRALISTVARRRLRVTTTGKPRTATLLVRVGARTYRTRAASLVIDVTAVRAVWVAWQTPLRGSPRWVRVTVR